MPGIDGGSLCAVGATYDLLHPDLTRNQDWLSSVVKTLILLVNDI